MNGIHEKKWSALAVLNVLMNCEGYLTTYQIAHRADCNRKTVYASVQMLETYGFGIDIQRMGKQNAYKYIGLYGL